MAMRIGASPSYSRDVYAEPPCFQARWSAKGAGKLPREEPPILLNILALLRTAAFILRRGALSL